MSVENVILESSIIEISELTSHPDYLNAKFIICDFEKNKNGVKLNRDTVENWMDTLVGSPLVGKIAKNLKGNQDFTSHNLKIISTKDKNGKKKKKALWVELPFGVFK